MKNNSNIYLEKQGFAKIWIIALLSLFLLIPVIDVYRGHKEIGGLTFDFGLLIILVLIIYFSFAKLWTTVDAEGIEITFLPFAWRKRWAWKDVQEVYIRKYSLYEFGGWGYRLGSGGTAYTSKGKHGVQLEFKNGKKILVGTQHPEEIKQFITKIRENG
ncbi:hypothetical protein [Sphingobacterium faecale]|uniref:PH domain-containing protein n=1 Tax=Sphingobacterium faecale TaxID=2803775 RepID=A0ABS1R7D4_9SPHI|nr:hypothetical protein [Sphingobacterium faecale]MBL1410612.1 hypothetical protein [Sphingobacterium faecale]